MPRTIYKNSEGQRLPGVTTICGVMSKDTLIAWANRIGLEGTEVGAYVDDKAAIGTLAHALVMAELTGSPLTKEVLADYSPNQVRYAENASLSFYEWLKSHRVEVIECEHSMISEDHQFGGTDDIYAIVDGAYEVLDLKSGSGIYPEHVTQVAGGYGILRKENRYKVDRFRILNIPRTANENWGELLVGDEQVRLHQKLFLACLDVYNLRRLTKNEKVVYARRHDK